MILAIFSINDYCGLKIAILIILTSLKNLIIPEYNNFVDLNLIILSSFLSSLISLIINFNNLSSLIIHIYIS